MAKQIICELIDSAKLTDNDKIVAVYEDARVLANHAVWAVELQIQRIKTDDSEIREFVMRSVVDFHFLVTGLLRIRRMAELVNKFSDISKEINQFDETLPDLKKIRNVQEHIDEYLLDEGRNKQVNSSELLTIVLDHDCIRWLTFEIKVNDAIRASDCLFQAIVNNPPAAYKKCVASNLSTDV